MQVWNFAANLQGGHISIERQKRLGNTYEDKYKDEGNITRFGSRSKLAKKAIIR
jgi:hypothetical protein